MRIPKNYDSGKEIILGMPISKWISSIVWGAGTAFILKLILNHIFGIKNLYVTIFTFIVGVLFVAGLAFYCLSGGDPYVLVKEYLTYQIANKKLDYRHPKKHKKREEKSDSLILTLVRKIYPREYSGPRKEYYTQQKVAVREIIEVDGLVLLKLKDNTYVRIIEIASSDFMSIPTDSTYKLINSFPNLMRFYDGSVQIKIKTEFPNMHEYCENLLKKAYSEDNGTIIALAGDITEHVEMTSYYSRVNRFYLISRAGGSLREAYAKLKEFELKVDTYVCIDGVEKVVYYNKDDEVKELEKLLYTHYNHPELGSKTGTLDDRRTHIEEALNRFSIKGEGKLVNRLSPLGYDYTQTDVVYSSGLYHQTLILADIPNDYGYGWLGNFFAGGDINQDVTVWIEREEYNKIQIMLNGHISRYVAVKNPTEQLIETYEDAEYIKKYAQEEGYLYYFVVGITLHARTLKELRAAVKSLIENAATRKLKLSKARFLQEPAYDSTAPFGILNKRIFDKFKRNTLSEGLVTLYPFLTTSAAKKEGVVFGVNQSDGSPVIVDLFRPRPCHTLVIGSTGSGKSFSTMMQVTRCRIDGTQVIVLMPTKGHEYKQLCEDLGGAFIPIGPGYDTTLNVLGITPEVSEYDESDRFVTRSLRANKINELITFFTLAFPSMSAAQKDALSPALIRLYDKFGIGDDNQSIYDDTGKLKVMPLIEDFQKILEDDLILYELAPQLNKFITGHLRFFNKQTNTDLTNKFTVLDLTSALEGNESDMGLLVHLANTMIKNRVKSNTTQRKVILFEESWMFRSDPRIFATIEELYRTARSYNAACFCVTQSIRDFMGAEGILNNVEQFIFFKCEKEDANEARRYISALTEEDSDQITTFGMGDALIVRNKKKTWTHFQACGREAWLYETDPEKRKLRYQQ